MHVDCGTSMNRRTSSMDDLIHERGNRNPLIFKVASRGLCATVCYLTSSPLSGAPSSASSELRPVRGRLAIRHLQSCSRMNPADICRHPRIKNGRVHVIMARGFVSNFPPPSVCMTLSAPNARSSPTSQMSQSINGPDHHNVAQPATIKVTAWTE